MRHLDEGRAAPAGRRFGHDPSASRHLSECATCSRRYEAVAADAGAAAAVLRGGSALMEAEDALRRLHRRMATEVPPKPRFLERLVPGGLSLPRQTARPVMVVALVAIGLTTLFVTGVAESMVRIFEPQQVAAIAINANSVGSLPDLSAYGTPRSIQKPDAHRAAGWSDAGNQTGLSYLQPGSLPAAVHGTPAYYFLSQGKASFTFDAKTAAATAAARGVSLPALPGNIDGSTLFLQAGPGAVEVVGAPAPTAATKAQSANSILSDIPELVIVQAKAPVVTSNGPSVADFENALLAMPGISPDLAAQVRAIGDPSSTLPIPIPTNLASSQNVQVNGHAAVLIGDNTGVGSAVVWVDHGDGLTPSAGP